MGVEDESLENVVERCVVRVGLEEVKNVVDELLRVVRDHRAVVQARVDLVRLDYVVAHLFPSRLGSRVGALRIQVTEEEPERCAVNRTQIVQLGLFIAEGDPVVVRVSLEAALLGILGVVVEALHRDLLED